MAFSRVASAEVPGRFSKWRRVLILPGLLLLAVVLFYGEENWRGHRAWEKCKRELGARGQILETQSFIPPRVPDDQNVFNAPKMAEWFEVNQSAGQMRSSPNFTWHRPNPITIVRVSRLPPGANDSRGEADVCLDYTSPVQTEPSSAEGAEINIPDIIFNEVNLIDAIRALATQAGRKIQFDPALLTGILAGQVKVTVKWRNLTGAQALFALLNNYGLALVSDPATHTQIVTSRAPAAQTAAQQFARQPGVQAAIAPRLRRAMGYSVPSQWGFLLAQNPLDQIQPLHIVFRANSPLMMDEIQSFMREFLPADFYDSGLTFESAEDGSFLVRLPMESAAGFLAWSEQLEPDFDLIHQGLQRPQAQRDDYQQGPPEMPNFVNVRIVSQDLAQRAQCHLLLGQPDLALRDLALMRDLLRVCDTRPLGLEPAMMYVAVTGLYVSTIADGLRLQAWREPELAALEEQLHSINLPSTMVMALATKRAFDCQKIESMTPAGFVRELTNSSGTWGHVVNNVDPPLFRLLSSRAIQPMGQWLKNWLYPANPWLKSMLFSAMPRGWRRQNMVATARLQQELLDSIDVPNGLIWPDKTSLYAHDLDAVVHAREAGTFLAALFAQDLSTLVTTTARNQTFVNEAAVACALERCRLARGQWPGALEDLVPRFIDKLPRDLIGGRPLIYRPGEGGLFLLYSVGWNGADDGGTSAKYAFDGDWVWLKQWP